jgi:hypothetical protein
LEEGRDQEVAGQAEDDDADDGKSGGADSLLALAGEPTGFSNFGCHMHVFYDGEVEG